MSDAPTPPAANPKAQAAAAKAYAKANRKWYQKKRWWFLAAIFVLIVIIASSVSSAVKTAEANHTVVYEATGTAKSADLTYTTDGSTSISQEQGKSLPWSKTLTIGGNIINVYQLEVQNGDLSGADGTVSCTIKVDGKVVKTVTSSGTGAIASCDYSPN